MIEFKTTFAVCLYLLISAAQAQTQLDQEQIQKSEQLTLSGLIDVVIEGYPDYEELPARLEEAAKYDDKASGLFADALSVEFRYQTGRIGNNDNLREYEAGVVMPLWRIGQRKASKQLARGIEVEANTFAALIRWELAGVLRSSLWRIALTADRVAKTEKAAEVSVDLLRGVERRAELGVLPQSDLLQAKQDILNSELRLSTARIEYANAINAYRIITEQNVIPASILEERSKKVSIDELHPALIYSSARLERSTAEYRLIQQTGTANTSYPTLLIGVRSERGGDDTTAEESVGVSFSYPFGFGSQLNAERAAAGVQAATVRTEHRSRLRQLMTISRDAERNLIGAERESHLASQKSELAAQHLAMSVRAFELGEMHLFGFLLIKEVAFNAEMEASGKEIEWKSAIAQYNQAVGEMP